MRKINNKKIIGIIFCLTYLPSFTIVYGLDKFSTKKLFK